MAVDGVSSALAIRSSVGIELWSSAGPRLPYEPKPNFPREETKNSRSISFSPDGRFFAYTNGSEIKVLKTTDWQLQCAIPRPKAFYLKFSPRGNYLCTWELYTVTKDKPEGAPNMFVYELPTGAEVLAIVQKKQTDWEPSWALDESLLALIVGGEARFYDLGAGAAGFKSVARRIGGSHGGMLSVAPGHSPPYLAFYTPGSKGGPSMCKLYKYPALESNQAIACKSFFQADRVEMLWNKRGTGLLLLTSTEVDKSGASYYGNQAVHFMNNKGDSCSVPLSKDGPVHCVKWSPKATEFVVVYGFMPSKAALYNLKCDVIFDFGEGPRNCAYFNPFGNLVVLAGFGNLPGNVEMWDVQKREKLANIKCLDTTHFEWNPNGEHFVTATTAPRLRIGNGFKVYHYSGALLHETIWPQGQELLGVEWQQFAENTFQEPVITKVKQEGIKSSQPEASKKVYTPPHLRLKKEGKNPDKYIPQPQPQAQTNSAQTSAGGHILNNSHTNNNNNHHQSNNNNNNNNNNNGNLSHNNRNKGGGGGQKAYNNNNGANGNNNNNNNNPKFRYKARKQQKEAQDQLGGAVGELNANDAEQQNVEQQRPPRKHNQGRRANHQLKQFNGSETSFGELQTTSTDAGPPHDQLKKLAIVEKEKKIRIVAKKLSDIKKLKMRQSQGETLESNQLNKISNEAKFLDELKSLKLATS